MGHFQNSVSFENGFAVSRLRLRNVQFLAVAFPKTEVLEKPLLRKKLSLIQGYVFGEGGSKLLLRTVFYAYFQD